MKFRIDEQTANDLELFDQGWDGQSVLSYFNYAGSDGGKACLKKMFESPLADVNEIRARAEAIAYLGRLPFFPEVRREELSFIEIYLQQDAVPKRNVYHLTSRVVKGWLNPDNDCYLRQRAVPYLGRLIHEMGVFMNDLPRGNMPRLVEDLQQEIKKVLAREGMVYLANQKKDSLWSREKLDLYFRGEELGGVRTVLDVMYTIDALRTVGNIAKERGLVFPVFTGERRAVVVEGLYHLFLDNPVRNDACLNDQQHLCFLTGPNMAGKSTYMKAFGVAVYLAHCGFPVPATRMELSVFRGLFTTINLSDNLSLGYSHYYNEVARLKHVMEQVKELREVVIVFDELFRGTNVKDAYDASFAVVNGLLRLKSSIFMISSHIVEVAEALQQNSPMNFRYFEVLMDEEKPRYTYRVREGISNERIGMYILRKERVIELIEALNESTT